MRSKPLISPSLMCMNLAKFSEQLTFLDSKVDLYHVDIMDGHFVPNLTLSPFFVANVNKICARPMDCHLMVTNPENYIDLLVDAGAKYISCHAETISGQAFRLIDKINRFNDVKIGVVLNPETTIDTIKYYIHKVDKVTVLSVDPGFAGQPYIPEMLSKIEELATYRATHNLSFLIEIDGSCKKSTYRELFQAGVDVFIVGTSGLFNNHDDLSIAWQMMTQDISEALQGLVCI